MSYWHNIFRQHLLVHRLAKNKINTLYTYEVNNSSSRSYSYTEQAEMLPAFILQCMALCFFVCALTLSVYGSCVPSITLVFWVNLLRISSHHVYYCLNRSTLKYVNSWVTRGAWIDVLYSDSIAIRLFGVRLLTLNALCSFVTTTTFVLWV